MRGTQLVLMTASGRLLDGDAYDAKTGKIDMARGLQQVLQAYAKLPEAERRPGTIEGNVRPQEPPPPGGLVLTIHDRPLGRDAEGRYRLPQGKDNGGFRTEAPHSQRSSLWLREQEWKALIPTDPKKGQTLQVPSKLARRIWLYGLVPQTLWVVEEFWKPDSAREGDLSVTVEDVAPASIRLRMHGSVLLTAMGVLHEWPNRKFIKNLENRYDARLEGVIVYDRVKQRITRWDMTALGDYSGRWFTGNNGWKEATREAPLPLGFAFELDPTTYDLPPERHRPRSFVHAYIFRDREEQYWDPDRWLEDWKKRQKK